MAAHKEPDRDRLPLEELSLALRCAVERIVSSPVPGDLTRTALADARDRMPRPRPTYARRSLLCGSLVAVALVGVVAIAWQFRGGRSSNEQSLAKPLAPEALATSGPSASDARLSAAQSGGNSTRAGQPTPAHVYLPTAWAYCQAARQSPEALDAILDCHAHQAMTAERQSISAGTLLGSIGPML